jgi:putative hydrolase of the HAD superfamily
MLDVDGVLVSGRPKDGRAWASDLDADLGVSQVDLQKAFFVPYCSDIVTGRRGLAELLKAALATIAPDVSHHDLIDYWFTNDSGLDLAVIAGLDLQRERGIKVYLATNQEHLRAGYLMNTLGLSEHCDGLLLGSNRLSEAGSTIFPTRRSVFRNCRQPIVAAG